MDAIYLIASLVSLSLLIYLFFSLIKPEWFE